jgi:hypothetical protein
LFSAPAAASPQPLKTGPSNPEKNKKQLESGEEVTISKLL